MENKVEIKVENKKDLFSELLTLRKDIAREQKRGLHFISASVVIWGLILCIHASSMPILQKNLYTFCCSAPLVVLAYWISKLIGVDFQGKSNPLTALGLLFTLNQLLYILIAMWVYAAVPDKMLMVYAMIFGAHLLPYGWLYQSKSYYIFSFVVTIGVLVLGLSCSTAIVACFMFVIEFIFCCCLVVENRMEKRDESRKTPL